MWVLCVVVVQHRLKMGKKSTGLERGIADGARRGIKRKDGAHAAHQKQGGVRVLPPLALLSSPPAAKKAGPSLQQEGEAWPKEPWRCRDDD